MHRSTSTRRMLPLLSLILAATVGTDRAQAAAEKVAINSVHRFTVNPRVKSIKGHHWVTEVGAELTIDGQPALMLPAESTSDKSWNETIESSGSLSSSSMRAFEIGVVVAMPDDPSLVGKQGKLAIFGKVRFPYVESARFYDEDTERFHMEVTVQFVATVAEATKPFPWGKIGIAAFGLVAIIALAIVARKLKKRERPAISARRRRRG